MNCIFCEILAGKLPASMVFTDEVCSAFMDIQPINPGHLLVVPNQHAAFLSELDPAVGGRMFQVVQRLSGALRQSGVRCDGVNLFLADGEAAGQDVFHVHLHVFPRFKGDGFGVKVGLKYHLKPPRSELDAIADKINVVLNTRL
jgi:histidine triad (HIT) family protein